MTHGSGCNMEEPQLQRRAPTSPRRRPSQPAAAAKMRRAISSEASGEATSSRQTMLHALTRFLRSTRRQSQPQDTPTRDHHRSKNANRSRSGRACSKASEQDEIPHGSQLGVRPPAVHPLPVTIVSDMGHVRSRIWENSTVTFALAVSQRGLDYPTELTSPHTDIVPVLAQLLEHSPATSRAYLCHPCVQHISKLRREGSCGFCGYRNIQMLISYIVGAEAFGAELFGNRVPPVFDIQDLIEAAWDMGYNPQGRIETGGIKGTRKFIGTPEVTLI
ncbi:peptidase family c78 domain-containing protein [Purpureocillium lilacinum]|uniref:Peptidase family c78 domain-containing protein n=1 Tax=Purpureocillium lilacinum TaxID=33203 RepID=A0A179H568_PURLI|nr:peptidase family c78 domain-containing protein [Purpureocillium lilacinum]OAQ85315.1 peptidase family c78 domain-containing protein [Purpureocillium lilacinum]